MPEPPAVERWEVPAALDGERVDRAIALITGLSRRDVSAVLDAGRVSIGDRPVESRSRKVRAGQILIVEGSLERSGGGRLAPDAAVVVPVVYHDDQVIVVDKPAGLVVHPGAGHREGTMVHGLLARFPDLATLAGPGTGDRPGIVHRLDKGTSGLLVVARTPLARAVLTDQLAARTMSREYSALVLGVVESDRGLIDAPLGRSDADPTRVRVQTGGRPARTEYRVERRFSAPVPATLIRCRLETGRTHQIRVHLASIGHPVVGDDRYGGRGPARWRPLPAGRPFLHASKLAFVHPVDGEPRTFTSPLPEDLLSVLAGVSPPGRTSGYCDGP